MSTANNAGGNRPQGQVYGASPTGRRTTPKVAAKKGPKGPIWAKVLIGFGALLLASSIGTFTAVRLVLNRVEEAIPTDDLLPQVEGGDTRTLDGALNILLVGTDERVGLDGNRADTIIVLHINANHDAVYLMSIPRDTLATIPAFPKAKFKGTKDKINSAFQAGSGNGLGRKGGFELLAMTVTQLTGLSFDAAAIINFDGFTAVVEALGKVHMCIDSRTTSLDHDRNGKELFNRTKEAMVYEVGCRDLQPWQALDYVRQRKSLPDGDYGRQRHQQQFIKAIAHDAMSQGLTDPVKLNKVLGAAGQALTIDKGPNASLAEWLFLVKGLPIQDMIMLKANGGKYAEIQCGSAKCEHLTEESLSMFTAAKNDTLPAFIQAHPTWVADQSGPGTVTPSAGPSTTVRPSAR